MTPPEPQYIDLEPEKAPRTSAIILLVCGLMGVGFLMVNVVFTGEDPFQNGWWPEQAEEGTIQEQGNVLPNVWRGRGEDDEEEELADTIQSRRSTTNAPTTNPYLQLPGVEQFYKRQTLGAPQGNPFAKPAPPGTPPGKTAPGATGNPGAPAPAK